MVRTMPMFPLGSVLFPSMLLPLHIFEERYRALIKDVLAGDELFGVVLIERGPEVGGGDVRSAVGTVARVLQAEELEDGRWVVLAAGIRRLRVLRWLPDDPYPLAEIEEMTELPAGDRGSGLREEAAASVGRMSALAAELGEPAIPIGTEFDDDPGAASFQMTAVSMLGPLDAQRLLEIDDSTERLQALLDELAERTDTLERRLAQG